MPDETATPCRAVATVALADPAAMLVRLLDHLAEHGTVTRRPGAGRVDTAFGAADMEAGRSHLAITAESADASGLAFVKMGIAEHLIAFAVGEAPTIAWTGDDAAGRLPPFFREMTVLGTRPIAPRMRRITLAGQDLGRFAAGGLHLRLLIPPDRAREPVWPVIGPDGRPAWPEAPDRPAMRVYTIRRIDAEAGELDIDFVLHDGHGGPGAGFARGARPGDRVGIAGPGGGEVPRAEKLLLAGDETALPAIARILEAAAPGVRAVVRIEVEEGADEMVLPSAAEVDLAWLHRSDPAGPGLAAAVAAPNFSAGAGEIFAWSGSEFAACKAIRQDFQTVRSLPRGRYLAAVYWRRGFPGYGA